MSVDNLFVTKRGTPGYWPVSEGALPETRFHTAGGAARSVMKAVRSGIAPEAEELFFTLTTDKGAGFRVHVNCEQDGLSVAHQGHSDMANDFLDDVGRQTGWPNVAIALDALQKAVENGVLSGDSLEEHVRTEFVPKLRQWQDCLRQRDDWDEAELDRVAKSIERATKLDTVTSGPEHSPLDDVINAILRADDPVAAVLDEGALMELDYMDIPVALDPLTNEDLKMAEIHGGETCKTA